MLESIFSYASWTVRITVLVGLILWLRRRLISSPEQEAKKPTNTPSIIADALLLLLICSWGTYGILLCDPWNSLTAITYASAKWDEEYPGVRPIDQFGYLDVLRFRYRKGLTLGHISLQALTIPAFIAIRRKIAMKSTPTPQQEGSGNEPTT